MNQSFPLNRFFHVPSHLPEGAGAKELILNHFPTSSKPSKKPFSAEELLPIGKEIVKKLKDEIDENKYHAFFKDHFSLLSLKAGTIEFAVSTEYIKNVVEANYIAPLHRAIESVLGQKYDVAFSVITQKGLTPKTDPKPPTKGSAKEASFSIDLVPTREDKFNSINSKVLNYPNDLKFRFVIDPKKTFDNFIVGPSNNMACASALAVAKNPGALYPCLYLYSPSGLGKTHLLHAVANTIKNLHPTLVICITTARDFMTEMIDSIQKKSLSTFRKKYSEDIDVLMIDDIHDLKNKEGTQNEFFHIFNRLHNKGKQLIFTSDKHPKDINGIEERIKTRLTWGLVLDIQTPDLETRLAILKNKTNEEDIFLHPDILSLIATKVKSNIRDLEGSLIRLIAYANVFGVDIDMETAKEQLNLCETDEQKSLTLDSITSAVSEHFKIPVPDIKSKSRLKAITEARHTAMFLSHSLIQPAPTYVEIGKFFGGRDHTSVMHAIEKIRRVSKRDQKFSQNLLEIESSL
ncbi:MAG: chromosomal replication initiator protein DnaA [Bacteriovoracales bacterium]|nr:chromosomal replication initiator protein DnaA [Bacteriovoracales bacterium]